MKTTYSAPQKGNYTLKNVLLETGFVWNDDYIEKTQTEKFCIEIKNGKIDAISPNQPQLPDAVDAKGLLMLPAFKDMHTHLDKTLYGLPWKAVSPKRKTVADMIAYEQQIIPKLLETSVHRTGLLIDLLQNYGTCFARSHFNVDTTSGLRSLENLQIALDNKRESFSAELVAFPQHGLYYTDSAPLMREVAQMDGVDFIGGLDPYGIDKNIEKAIDFTVQLALDHNKGIDIHLHDLGKEGKYTIEYLIQKVKGNPQLQNKTFVSHAYVLAYLEPKEVDEISEKLAEAKVGIVSAIPYRDKKMPLPKLIDRGVEVLVGNDNIQDHWSTLGTGNILQKANLMAELYAWETEYDLSRTLRFATNNILPLDNKGNMQWPQKGDKAEFTLINASCSAEAVSRISPTVAFAHEGNLYWKN